MYDTWVNLPAAAFGDLERLRREFDDFFHAPGLPSSIRSVAAGSFPPINVGHTPASVEVYAFAPGLDAAKIDVTIDRGVLTLAGERTPIPAPASRKTGTYGRERPSGAFRRAISLPEDIDPAQVQARYRDGVLNVSIARRAAAQPQRITVQ